MFNLKNKTIIITGGVGVLGNVFCRRCVEAGADVVIVDIEEKTGLALSEELNKQVKRDATFFCKCDITNENDVDKLVVETLKRFKKIDVLVNNAYPKNKNYGRKFEDVTFKDFCENLDSHVGGYFLLAKKVSEIMVRQKQGNIINMGSHYGIVAPDFRIYDGTSMTMPVEYSPIKAGIINFTKYLATYLAKYNIRANSLSPGGVFNNQPESFVKNYCDRTPLGRMANPDDIAGGILFLASDASRYMTGHNLVIDGGCTIW